MLDQFALVDFPLTPSVSLDLFGRTAESVKDWELWEYGADIQWSPTEYTDLGFRLSQTNLLPDSFSRSNLFLWGTLNLPVASWLHFHIALGWYRRWVLLQKTAIIPSFRSSYSEHDFAARVALHSQWSPSWGGTLEAATFDEFSIFNLNHPFVQGRLNFVPEGQTNQWDFYFRYHLLLGFGRLDQWMLGVSYKVEL